MIISTDGIVLRTFDYRETSKIATFFTRDQGKISGVMKGIRKDPRKFGSSVDRFSVNGLVYYEYRNSNLHLISQCDLKQYFFKLREVYRKNVAANYSLELVDVIMPVESPNKEIYDLMLDYFNTLEVSDDIDKLVHAFQIKVLLHSGFRPHIDSCVKCGKKVGGKVRFSMRLGGLICERCPTRETSFVIVSRGAIASMLFIESHKWDQCIKLKLHKNIQQELKFILNNFLVYHLEKRIRSLKFLMAKGAL
ncbi:MAG: DNA repair protein RecO [Candidatus Omnitrophica bacterium]|nr:DNA repair protein RecO [Candidatus Omnitrophota bacterium]